MTDVNAPGLAFDPNRALPAAAYRDPEWLAAEQEKIWHGDWVFAAMEDALAAPGDQLPVVIGDQPVLLVRNEAGELAALSNLCAHRGTLLVNGPTNAGRIQCPYHAWTYDHDGRLIAAPFAPEDVIDKQAHCLPAYRVESWHGLVFVSLDPDVEPLAERFAAIAPHVSSRESNGFRHLSQQQATDVWECNWKVAMMNGMESYHVFKVHATTIEPYTPTRDAYYITGSARATATGGSNKGEDDYLLISLPPGFVGVFTQDSFVWQAVSPLGQNRCTVRTGGSFVAGSGARGLGRLGEWFGWIVGAAAYPVADFLPEDKAICERVQRGVTGDFVPGRLVPVERVVVDFGHYLNWRLNGIEPPAVHSEPVP